MREIEKVKEKLSNGDSVTFIFVGDSITQGTSHCTDDETYVAIFAKCLADEFKNASVYRYDGKAIGAAKPLNGYKEVLMQKGNCGRINVLRSGVGGSTVNWAMGRFSDYTGVLPCGTRSDYIFTMFGINDSITSVAEKYVTPDVFKTQYGTMFDKLAESEPQAKIIVMPATTNDFDITAHVKVTFELAREKNLLLIDTFKLWSEHYIEGAENFGHGDWLKGGTDACHPMPKASKIMAEYIYNEFKVL